MKRLLDVLLAGVALLVTAPLVALAAVLIRRVSRGPALYRTVRVGRGGAGFVMYKLRTMQVRRGAGWSAITGQDDPRVFGLGVWLRRTKLDELPQLFNVLRGEMAIVGPRPEDPRIVAAHYTPLQRETLTVRPGLTSPGSVYSYTHGEALLCGGDPEAVYVATLLPIKLALDLVYVRRASLAYDLRLIGRTAWVLGARLLGKRSFAEPPEMTQAHQLILAGAVQSASPRPRTTAPAIL